ncbi:MAG: cell wall hydrolase [Geminicoccaceae bacterium]
MRQGQESGSCQFSWWCDGKSDDVEDREIYDHVKDIARAVINGDRSDPTRGAIMFHAENISPDWIAEFARTTTIGGHIFYRRKE